ncbi:MAG: aldo/keto reductase [Planctomycetes bacterium]|nr:aldo/keto reductase [Planctomycetota bacterium]
MEYRDYGKSGFLVSEIGLGGHREGVEYGSGSDTTARYFDSPQVRAAVVGRAIDSGVIYFDTTYGCEIESLGESLRILGKRDGLFVSGMRVDFFKNMFREKHPPKEYARREVESRLEEFGFDDMDQFMLGALDFDGPLENGRSLLEDAVTELLTLRDQGKFRYLGFSCHDPDYGARIIEAFDCFDAVMAPYNFANRQAEAALLPAARERDLAFIAMKTLVWRIYGLPVTCLRNLGRRCRDLGIDADVPIGRLAHRFVLDNLSVATCVPAANSPEAVDENISASGMAPLDDSGTEILTAYADATQAHDMIPFAIAGLYESNLRLRSYAINNLAAKLHFDIAPVDYSADDAPRQSDRAARDIMAALSGDPGWSAWLDERPAAGGAC